MASDRYDAVPYPSTLFPQTHPDRTGALAALFGMDPAPVDRCRVLELGCGDGSNLIPMALSLPESRFVGVDLAAQPVARGTEIIKALGLENVTLRQANILDLARDRALADGPFDYIIAHGLYSWVPSDVRTAVLGICRDALGPQGVAFVSYNAFPGGHIRQMAREALLFHAAAADPTTQTAAAQGFAQFLAAALPAGDEFAFLRHEFRAIAERSPDLLFHDDLSPDHQPLYFHQFVEQASAHGLQYLAEADFQEMGPAHFSAEVQAALAAIEQARGLVAKEQYMDFLKVRRFRQTLLCPAAARIDRAHLPQRVDRLLVGAPLRPGGDRVDLAPGAAAEFHGPRGSALSTAHPATKAALLYIGEQWPRRVAWTELWSHAASVTGTDPQAPGAEQSAQGLREALVESAAAGVVTFYAHGPRVVARAGDYPATSPLTRLLAGRPDVPLLPTLLHTAVRIDDALGRYLLQLLDGTRTRAELLARLAEWARSSAGSSEARHQISAARLDDSLRGLAGLGFLSA
ncbi:MAG TPA: class I SAM-dependent methyltransferase [Chloroflexota bacterium]|nr:class I SAM-dependent methyltransferase [Chloroflexota bacterium]